MSKVLFVLWPDKECQMREIFISDLGSSHRRLFQNFYLHSNPLVELHRPGCFPAIAGIPSITKLGNFPAKVLQIDILKLAERVGHWLGGSIASLSVSLTSTRFIICECWHWKLFHIKFHAIISIYEFTDSLHDINLAFLVEKSWY